MKGGDGMKINWKSKLGSRKFWALVAGFVSSVLLAFNADNVATQVTSIITAFGSVAVYIFAESSVDKEAASSDEKKSSEN